MQHLLVDKLTLLIPTFPLLGFILSVWKGRRLTHRRRRMIVVLTAALCCVAGAGIVGMTLAIPQSADEPLALYRWLDLSDELPLNIVFGLRADRVALVFVLIASLGVALASWHGAEAGDRTPGRGVEDWAVSLSLFAAVAAVLSTNFVQLLFFWQLGSVTAVFLVPADSRLSPRRDDPSLLAARLCADVLLTLGIILIWWNFETVELGKVLDQARVAGVETARPGAVAAIGLCLVGGIVGRCVQFPLMGLQSSAGSVRIPAILEGATLVPVGLYLAVRCAPLLRLSENVRIVMVILSGVTAIGAAWQACTRRAIRDVLSDTTAALFGLMLIAIAAGTQEGATAVLAMCVVHSFCKCGLYSLVADGQVGDGQAGEGESPPARHWSVALGLIVLGMGFGGQSAILASVWSASVRAGQDRLPDVSLAPGLLVSARHFLLTVFALCVVHVALCAAALAKVWLMTKAGRANNRLHRAAPTAAILIATVFCITVAGPTGWFSRYVSPLRAPSFEPFSLGWAFLPATLGAIAAWIAQTRAGGMSDNASPSVRAADAPTERPPVQEFYFLCLAIPLRALAQICRLLDWLVIDGLLIRLPAYAGRIVVAAVRPLQNGLVQFYALATLLSAAVLLAALLWLTG